MRVTVLAGGVGGAKFLRGLRTLDGLEISVVANTGDDLWLTGLRVCPDLDSIMYALGGINDTERGWGRADETERVSAELTAYGVGWPWFTLGDLDLGTHIARSSMLRDGATLTEATARLAARWNLGVRLLPATDDEVETHVEIVDPVSGDVTLIPFEEWWVKHRARLDARRFVPVGVEAARATDAVLTAIGAADVVLLAPSNPVVSIGTILGLPGIVDALRSTTAPVVGVSPIIGGSAVRGMADACLRAIGVDTTAEAVALHYRGQGVSTHPQRSLGAGVGIAGRPGGEPGAWLDGWVVDSADARSVPRLEAAGIRSEAVPLWMTDDAATAKIAASALALAMRADS